MWKEKKPCAYTFYIKRKVHAALCLPLDTIFFGQLTVFKCHKKCNTLDNQSWRAWVPLLGAECLQSVFNFYNKVALLGSPFPTHSLVIIYREWVNRCNLKSKVFLLMLYTSIANMYRVHCMITLFVLLYNTKHVCYVLHKVQNYPVGQFSEYRLVSLVSALLQ